MKKEIVYINEKIFDLNLYSELQLDIEKNKDLEKKLIELTDDFQILFQNFKKYKKPKFLYIGKNSLLNLLKDEKESKKILLNNKYGILGNLLYKYKDTLNNDLYQYMYNLDKKKMIKHIRNGNSNYLLKIINLNEIEDNLLKLMIYTEPKLLSFINLTEYDEKLGNILKDRYQVYFDSDVISKNIEDSFENMIEFYNYLITNPIFNSKETSLSSASTKSMFFYSKNFLSLKTLIEKMLNLSDNNYELCLKYSLIAPIFKYIKKNKDWQDDLELMLNLCKFDINCYSFASERIKQNEQMLLLLFENSEIDEDIICNNIPLPLKNDISFHEKLIDKLSFKPKKIYKHLNQVQSEYLKMFQENKVLSKNKDLIKKLILKTPIAFRYIDKNLIDEEMIEELLNEFEPKISNNNYYKIFSTDKRFYQHYLPPKNSNYNILKTISNYVEVKKAGPWSNDYLALCPFHDDHNPSLRISPIRGIFTCFACGISGNAQTFVKEYIKLSQEKYNLTDFKKIKEFPKNKFYYYLYTNLPDYLKRDLNIIKKFLNIDGCILKLVPKELKYNEELVELAINQDILAFRYIMNNETYQKKYIEKYPILNYYLPKTNKPKPPKKKYKITTSITRKPQAHQLSIFDDINDISNNPTFEESIQVPVYDNDPFEGFENIDFEDIDLPF